ncbi:MAG: FAD-dependent oxidoreductase [Polyangiaceae bacterium]
MPPPPMFEARLVSARKLASNVRELTFERLDAAPMDFDPGQWVNVLLPQELAGEGVTKRSYSIASAPDRSPRFEVAVTRVQGGPASTWLHALELDAILGFSGPQGFFTRAPRGGPPSLMIATGTGLTPMRSMLLAALATGSRAPIWVLLGVRHAEDLLYGDELRRLAREHPFIRFEPTLSNPPDDWQGRRGYVQTHVRELWAELAAASESEPHAYVCGLERMVGSVRDLLRKEIGLPRQRVHAERYD